MNLRPPAPLNSIAGAVWMAAFVLVLIVAYRKFAPAAVQARLKV